MRHLVCPGCGCTGDVEAFVADSYHKQAMALALKQPAAVQAQLADYLRLFSPPARSLTGARTLRLVKELAELVVTREITHDRRPVRPCMPRHWGEGMRQMVERKGGFKSHFTNHNYLKSIVYDLADQADAAAEKKTEALRRSGKHRDPEPDEGMSEDSRRLIEETRRKLGRGGA